MANNNRVYQATNAAEHQKLKNEFKAIDENGDGRVDKIEMSHYLAQKGVDEDHRDEIVNELFGKCDQDHNGKIDLDEFIQHFIDTKNQLMEQDAVEKQKIIQLHKEIEVLKRQQASARNNYAGLQNSILKIAIARGENFITKNTYQLEIQQADKQIQTSFKDGPNPQWNENHQTDVQYEQAPLIFTLREAKGQQIFRTTRTLDWVRNQAGQPAYIQEFEGNASQPRVLLTITFVEQESQRVARQLSEKEKEMALTLQRKQSIAMFVDQLSTPFGFITKDIHNIERKMAAREGEEMNAEQTGDHKYYHLEKNFEKQFDAKVQDLATKQGLGELKFDHLMKYTLLIYFVITSLAMLYRPDFMSITVVAIGIYAVLNPHYIKREQFRLLVVFVFITFVYDLVFLLFLRSIEEEDEINSQQAVNLRRFAYFFCWISFALRPVVLLVIWKNSLNFTKYYRNHGDLENAEGSGVQVPGHNNEEFELARIQKMYENLLGNAVLLD